MGGTQLKGFVPNELYRMTLGYDKAYTVDLAREKNKINDFYASLKANKFGRK